MCVTSVGGRIGITVSTFLFLPRLTSAEVQRRCRGWGPHSSLESSRFRESREVLRGWGTGVELRSQGRPYLGTGPSFTGWSFGSSRSSRQGAGEWWDHSGSSDHICMTQHCPQNYSSSPGMGPRVQNLVGCSETLRQPVRGGGHPPATYLNFL